MTPPVGRLVSRGDDAGVTRSADAAILHAHRAGVLKNASVQAVGGGLAHAAALLAGEPGLCVGLHVTLTCEWAGRGWRPVLPASRVPTLVGPDGRLPARVADLRGAIAEQAVDEAAAQLARLRSAGLRPAYADFHMGADHANAATADALAEWVLREGLVHGDRVAPLPSPGSAGVDGGIVGGIVGATAAAILAAPAGTYRVVRHPAGDDAETRSLHLIDDPAADVGRARAAEAACFTDARVIAAAQRRGMTWVRYDELDT